MAVENQSVEMFAGNRQTLEWAGILDEDGVSLRDLTGSVLKFAVARITNGVLVAADPVIDLASDDEPLQVLIPNPVSGDPHVQVVLLPADTVDLAPVVTTYEWQLEAFDASEGNPVMLATGRLKIKPNISNA